MKHRSIHGILHANLDLSSMIIEIAYYMWRPQAVMITDEAISQSSLNYPMAPLLLLFTIYLGAECFV